MRDLDRHLRKVGDRWHYRRRVPKSVSNFDPRKHVEASLKTKDIEVARIRRDEMEQADDAYWRALQSGEGDDGGRLESRYKVAVARAQALGFVYRTIDDLVTAPLTEIAQRVQLVRDVQGRSNAPRHRDVEALLGGVSQSHPSLPDVYEIYKSEIVAVELDGKSPAQRKKWDETKSRSVRTAVQAIGEKGVDQITRDDALALFNQIRLRVQGKSEEPGITVSTANRLLGDVRSLYSAYFAHVGDADRGNPFSGLGFKSPKSEGSRQRPPFPVEHLRDVIFPAIFAKKNILDELRCALLVLIETGCRPSEIYNLTSNQIMLDAEVPHIQVRFEQEMEIKNRSSVREVPLVGAALWAMKRHPEGFPRYYDRFTAFSNASNKFLRVNDLLPSKSHSVYSIRHTFEDRMIQAGVDADLRRFLMGHSIDHPIYGSGGSLSFKRDALESIRFDFREFIQ